jgi:hypothetical protein
MARLLSRMAWPAVIAFVLSVLLGSVALGAWSGGNSCSTGTFKICVSKHDNNGTPRATKNGSEASYVGDIYFNTDGETIDNSASSVKNLYAAQDVVWHYLPDNDGTAYCVDSNKTVANIGNFFPPDDAFSSHALAADDSACS